MGGVISRRKELDFLPTPPDLDSLGEPAVPHKGLDCYLDSLFDPVLSYGDAVGTQGAFEGHSRARAQEPLAAGPWGGWRGAPGRRWWWCQVPVALESGEHGIGAVT